MGIESAPAINTPEVERPANPVQAGIAWMESRGINVEQVAGIQLRGPRGACVGSFAEMVGTPGHEEWTEQFDITLQESAEEAAAEDRTYDPTEALMPWLKTSAARDEKRRMIKTDLEDLKKNGETAAS